MRVIRSISTAADSGANVVDRIEASVGDGCLYVLTAEVYVRLYN
jgi:hypothetical protein